MIALCLGIFLSLCAGSLTLWWAITSPRARIFTRARYRGHSKRRSIALTFDDGPSPGTPQLARLLRAEGIRATFFVCGANVERHPGLLSQLAAEGHEIGNHTYTHRRLCPRLGWKLNLLSPREVYAEFAKTQASIVAEIGTPPRWMRAPYGFHWFGMRAVERGLSLEDITWTVMGHDWEWSADAVVQQVVAGAEPGGIVCLHDGRDIRSDVDISVTIEAVRRIIPLLRERGFTFETVGELLTP